jgi:hypothetical protein
MAAQEAVDGGISPPPCLLGRLAQEGRGNGLVVDREVAAQGLDHRADRTARRGLGGGRGKGGREDQESGCEAHRRSFIEGLSSRLMQCRRKASRGGEARHDAA